jgi:hypothetical protein
MTADNLGRTSRARDLLFQLEAWIESELDINPDRFTPEDWELIVQLRNEYLG